MTDEQTAAAIIDEHYEDGRNFMHAAIVRALQAARKEGGKQVVDEAERVSQILQSANTANADNESKARFEVDRFAFACAGSVVGSTLTDYQKHALFHQFKNMFDSHESALQAARESALDTHANAAVLRMCHEARMMNGIVDYSDPNAVGVVRKVLGMLPVTADGVVPGDVKDHGAMVFLRERNGEVSAYRMTLCIRCIQDPDDESKEWGVVENDELSTTSCRWYSTREAAEAAKEGKA